MTLRPLDFLLLSDGLDGFRIHLGDGSGQRVTINYPDGVLCYRSSDEGDRLRLFSEQPWDGMSLIYKVENSHFLEWFMDQSYNCKFNDIKISHFAIFSRDNIIDILDSDYPEVTAQPSDAADC